MSATTKELRALAHLALPAIATQVGSMAMGVVDTIMVGRYGVEALAGVALGNTIISVSFLFGLGVVLGMDPIVSQAHGAGDGKKCGRALQWGILASLIISLPMALIWCFTETILGLFGQELALAEIAQDYVGIQVWSLPFFYVFCAQRSYLQGRSIVRPAMWIMLAANLINVAVNWLFIWGNLGMPELGATGAGLASSAVRVFLMLGLTAWIILGRLHEGAWVPWDRIAFQWRAGIGRIFHFGLPIGLQMVLEVGAFAGSTLLAGRFGAIAVNSHSIALNLASFSFMLPLGISIAATTRVGNLIGAGDHRGAQRSAWVTLACGGGVMAISAMAFILLRHSLPALYSTDPAVIALCATILPIAAAFQVFDGVQIAATGVLRGMGRTRAVTIFNFLAYWVLALPLAWYLTNYSELGIRGIWWSLCCGLAIVASGLVYWIHKRGPASAEAIRL
ncbi:MAG: MATE family efflux transporter [Planctomycetota bacterium]|nr:MATE family efflux transporter [Planctomycetota bacterium]